METGGRKGLDVEGQTLVNGKKERVNKPARDHKEVSQSTEKVRGGINLLRPS